MILWLRIEIVLVLLLMLFLMLTANTRQYRDHWTRRWIGYVFMVNFVLMTVLGLFHLRH